MCRGILQKKNVLQVMVIVLVLGVTGPVLAELVAYWPMDDGAGTVVTDVVGNNDGTMIGLDLLTAWIDDGKLGEEGAAVRFDGTAGQQILVPHSEELEFGDVDFSISLFVRYPNAPSGEHRWIIKGTHAAPGSGSRYELFIKNENVRWAIDDNSIKTRVEVSSAPFITGEWVHVVAVRDVVNNQLELYANGILQGSAADGTGDISNGEELRIGNTTAGDSVMTGDIDDVRIYANALTIDEITSIPDEIGSNNITRRMPRNEATEVMRDVILSWKPPKSASTYDVYLGTNFDDVNDGLALVSPGQDANSYDAGRLEYGQTYYWRVDGISAPPESEIAKGNVWSFTVESFSYPISADNITTTASSYSPDQGPENTIDGSGLVDDLHSTEITDMWATAEGQALPAWIQYEFDKTYKLHEMLVWNYNGQSFLSVVGLKDVVVEYSTDGANWTQINSVSEFARASGTDGYASNTTVVFGDVPVRYVKITVNSNWSNGFTNQCGLSEVRFLSIPVGARRPDPDDGAIDVAIDVILGWRAGREAAEHNVYISADEQAVIGGTVAAMTVGEATSYGPLSLDLGSTYYWRVDEVNNANTVPVWEGGTWSFTTQEYLVVDDFESYNDIHEGEEGSNLVYLTWIDGFDNPATNGSTIGYPTGASMETDTVHGGRQSVPVMYDNTVASFSEVTVNTSDLAIGGDWTVGSPEMLVLWVYGDPNNPATDRMYVKVDSAKAIYDSDLAQEDWQDFPIDLASLGINLSNVVTVTIGLEKIGATGGSGTVLIDDIWLYSPAAAQ